jgi:uncharacterized membrane protein
MLETDAAFCSGCGKKVEADKARGDIRAAIAEFAAGSVHEAKSLSVEALRSDTGKKVAAGAALGATVGLIVPLIGPAIGATLGAGYVAFKRLTR